MKSSAQSPLTEGPAKDVAARKRALQRWLQSPWVEFAIASLILLSVAITVAEASFAARTPWLRILDGVFSGAFFIELGLRAYAGGGAKSARFWRSSWFDVLALVPGLPWLHTIRPLRLLRFLRLIRLFDIARKRTTLFRSFSQKGVRELVSLLGLVFLTVITGSVAVLIFERDDATSHYRNFYDAFWFSLYSLLSNQPTPEVPVTFGARVVSVGVMFMGLITFATVTGTASAFISERMRKDPLLVAWDEIVDHLVICGWNRKAEIIVSEYVAAGNTDIPVVVIAEFEGRPPFLNEKLRAYVQFINEDFTKVAVLEKAQIQRAKKCILLSDTSRGRRERDADARTILAALTIEKLNHEIYTCAEINRAEYAPHLTMGHVNDFVVSGEHSAFLLAQAAIAKGVMGVLHELLTFQQGNRFERVQVPPKWQGKSYTELLVFVREHHHALLVAVEPPGAKVTINPKNYAFLGTEEIVVLTPKTFTL